MSANLSNVQQLHNLKLCFKFISKSNYYYCFSNRNILSFYCSVMLTVVHKLLFCFHLVMTQYFSQLNMRKHGLRQFGKARVNILSFCVYMCIFVASGDGQWRQPSCFQRYLIHLFFRAVENSSQTRNSKCIRYE